MVLFFGEKVTPRQEKGRLMRLLCHYFFSSSSMCSR
jgi:hypothetical protein